MIGEYYEVIYEGKTTNIIVNGKYISFKQLKKKIPTIKEKDYKDKLSYVRVL